MRSMFRLTDKKCRSLGPGLHADGGNLYLRVYEAGSKSWVFRWKVSGLVHERGLGGYPNIKLRDARERADEFRVMISKQQMIPKRQRQQKKGLIFRDIVSDVLEIKRKEWTNAKSYDQWYGTLRDYAFPVIGDLSAQEIDVGHIVDILKPIWRDKHETASRLRARIEHIMGFAIARGYRQGMNPAILRGNLDAYLPAVGRAASPRKHTMLAPEDAPEFFRRLRNSGAMSSLALMWLMLSACRSGEVRQARWDQLIDDIWHLPADVMKARRRHDVPVIPPMKEILVQTRMLSNGPLIFPGSRPEGQISDTGLAKQARRCSQGLSVFVERPKDTDRPLTVHGLRSTWRVWAQQEFPDFNDNIFEVHLAHVDRDKTRGSYARSSLIDQRRTIMESWANYLNS